MIANVLPNLRTLLILALALSVVGCAAPQEEPPPGKAPEAKAETEAPPKAPEAKPKAAPPETAAAKPAPAPPRREAPVTVTASQVDARVASAPACAAAADMDLKLRLIDYIDCADPDDPHDFKDQGTSRIVIGKPGNYRITAAHRHAFFSYRFRSAGKDKPVLIVIEYPDDAVRTINFSTHESLLSGRANSDWSLETGVYTGDPLPLSNRMQYHTFIMWPQDRWPAVLVGNFHRYGHPAAASRIWVYAIEGGLPKLEVDAPDPDNQRKLAHFNSFAFLPTAFHFGYRSPKAIEHMLDYAQYIGVNELAWCVVANNSWGAWVDVPAWPSTGRDRRHLDKVLTAMDSRGGFSFTACVGPEGNVRLGDKRYEDMTPDELRAAAIRFFDEFLDRYGKFKSLRAIGLGSQYGIGFYKRLAAAGIVQDVVSHIKAKRPDIQVMVFVGGLGLHVPYFNGSGGAPTAKQVYTAFETGDRTWPQTLGDYAHKAWRAWRQDPVEMAKIDGLDVYEQYQPDDYRIFGLYAQQPRAIMYFDLDNSQPRSDIINSHYAAMWNTHFEGWYGLHPEVNFWYKKLWVAPDFNAPPPLSLASFARIMGHRDRLVIMPGSWNNKYFGYEKAVRRFAKAYRSLPPVPMTDVADMPLDTVKVRWLLYKGKRYVSVQSLIPFASRIAVDGEAVKLDPFELAVLTDGAAAEPVVTGKVPSEYTLWIAERILKVRALMGQVKQLDPEAAPKAYSDAMEETTRLLTENRAHAADQVLGAGLVGELQLRKDILQPPSLTAHRLAEPPKMTGDLNAWPAAAADIRAEDGRFIAGHLYFPNSWHGPKDLSARIRLGHDGETLYVGLHVRDDVLGDTDGCQIRLCTHGAHTDWASESRKSNVTWVMKLPVAEDTTTGASGGFSYTCRRVDDGYVLEGKVPLAKLNVAPGGAIGWLLDVKDIDGDAPNLKAAGWAAKQVLLVPHRPNFMYWSDARNCGKLIIAE